MREKKLNDADRERRQRLQAGIILRIVLYAKLVCAFKSVFDQNSHCIDIFYNSAYLKNTQRMLLSFTR